MSGDSSSSMVKLWLEVSDALFEVFFEEKLGLYHAAITCLMDAATEEGSETTSGGNDDENSAEAKRKKLMEAALLSGPLQTLTDSSEFIDVADQVTQILYSKLPSGFGLEGEEGSGDTLYGELTPEGVRQMVNYFWPPPPPSTEKSDGMGNTSGEALAGKRIGFVDLGSGTGKVCVDVALLLATSSDGVQGPSSSSSIRSFGIEYVQGRHLVAVEAMRHLKNPSVSGSPLHSLLVQGEGTKKKKEVEEEEVPHADSGVLLTPQLLEQVAASLSFTGGSFLDPEVISPATQPHLTHFFCCGVGFDKEMVLEICDVVAQFVDAAATGTTSGEGSSSDGVVVEGFKAALFLFRRRPKHRLFDELCNVEVRPVAATWMDEAPAYFLTPRKLCGVGES